MLRRSNLRVAIYLLAFVGLAILPLVGLAQAAKATGRKGSTAKGRSAAKSPQEKSSEPAASDKAAANDEASNGQADDELQPVHKTDREWKRLLSPKEYRVTRQKETELPFSGKYVHTKKEGVYRCVCCGAKLFPSDTKFDSGTGWPSFYAPLNKKAIATAADYSDGASRVEVTCSRCDAHLGHVFGDGPEPTGLRYCINSVSLKLEEPPKSAVTKSGGDKSGANKSATNQASGK
jgi:peptide-methionine (R)-S-oxide reductase